MPSTPVTLDTLQEDVLAVLGRLNDDLPPSDRVPWTSDTVLLGEGGHLDSLGIANFIVAVEDRIEQGYGTSLALSDQDLVDLFDAPSVTVAAFATFLQGRLNG